MTEQAAVIKVQLGIQADYIVLGSYNQRVDLNLAAVLADEGIVQLHHGSGSLADNLRLEVHLVSHAGCLEWQQTNGNINVLLDNLLRVLGSNLLDLHAAFLGANHNDLCSIAVIYKAQIILLGNVGAFLNEKSSNLFALRTGLMGNQHLAQKLGCILLNLIQGLGNLYTASLAATACVNLCLYYSHLGIKLLCSFNSFLNGKCRNAVWNIYTERFQYLLTLILMNIHSICPPNLYTKCLCTYFIAFFFICP